MVGLVIVLAVVIAYEVVRRYRVRIEQAHVAASLARKSSATPQAEGVAS